MTLSDFLPRTKVDKSNPHKIPISFDLQQVLQEILYPPQVRKIKSSYYCRKIRGHDKPLHPYMKLEKAAKIVS